MSLNCQPGKRAVLWRNTTGSGCLDTALGAVVTVQACDVMTIASRTPWGAIVPFWSGLAWTHDGGKLRCPHCGGLLDMLPDCDLKQLPDEDDVNRHDILEAIQDVSRQMDENVVPHVINT